jgi:O-antigen/teichoic acid export membrane protein
MSRRAIARNVSWLTLASVLERLAALLQAVLVARALGVTGYGIYGLLVGTIGLAASIAGLQMGLTATVFIARYRTHEKARASHALRFANRFAAGVGVVFLLAALPFSERIAIWLLKTPDATHAVAAACLLTVFSIVSGVQDGIIQGFEDFRSVALARLATTLLTLLPIHAAGVHFGVVGVLAVVLAGSVLKWLVLRMRQTILSRQAGLPSRGEGIQARAMLWGFSVPSMLASLLTGTVGWAGTVALSRGALGFDTVALVTAGAQWCGPILLLSASVSTVAVPMLSRQHEVGDLRAMRDTHRLLLVWNGAGAVLAAGMIVALARPILGLYGQEFRGGAAIFSLLVASSIPQVIAVLYLQQLVAQGRMWLQLRMYLWLVVPMSVGYLAAIPIWGGAGFAMTNLIAWSILAAALAFRLRSEQAAPRAAAVAGLDLP